ncbi:MAG: DNA repair protein RecO [bacterium]|nr:DNA repair protein RecO [bacterium]MDZ4299344.1 DNA repair protein RecO [Candidatus Sungbacteria bacterium]
MHTTEGIILSKTPSGEADELVTMYTCAYGKVRALVQGVKKEEAKLRGHLEVLSLCTIGLVAGKNGERLVYAELKNFWSRIRTHAGKHYAAHYMVRRMDNACFPGERDERMWTLLTAAFIILEEQDFTTRELQDFLLGFEKQLVAHLGYGDAGIGSTLGPLVAQGTLARYTGSGA